MTISKILGLTNPCPHCDAQISRAKKLKNLLFCPACGGSLLPKLETPNDPNTTQKTFLWYFLASLGFALWHTTEYQGWEIGRYIEPVFWLFIMCCVGWIVFELLTGRLYRNGAATGNWIGGVDRLEVVQKDICPAYGTPRTNIPASGVTPCPHCQSQRVSDRYWYKRNMAQAGKVIDSEINQIEDDFFLGCLACGSAFEFQKKDSNREQGKSLLANFLMAVVLVTCLVLALWLFSVGRQQIGWVSQFSYFWLSGAGWFAVALFSRRSSDQQLNVDQRARFLKRLTPDHDHRLSH